MQLGRHRSAIRHSHDRRLQVLRLPTSSLLGRHRGWQHAPCPATTGEGFDPRSSDRPPATGSVYSGEVTAFRQVFADPVTQQGPSSSSSGGGGGTADGYMAGRTAQQQHMLGGSSSSSSSPSPSHAQPSTRSAPARDMDHHQGHAPSSSSTASSPTLAVPSLTSYSQYYKQQHARDMQPLTLPDQEEDSSSGPSASSSSGTEGATAPGNGVAADGHASVAEAFSRAEQALDKAESSLDSIESLPSARPDATSASRLASALAAARAITTVGALTAALLASHAFGLVVQWLSAAACGAAIAAWGYRKGSLSLSGAAAAAGVGLATLGCSLRLGLTLLAFFFSSSKLTQYKEEMKAALDDGVKKGGQRDWVQVFCNALVPTILAVVYGVLAGCVDVPLGPLPSLEPWRAKAVTALMGGFLGYYACCCGDTWASELGPLSADTPRLVTTLRPVRKGTNGGVTLLGLSASILGGAFIGATFYVAAVVSPTLFIFEQQHMLAIEQWKLIPLGLVAGLLGSLLDSLLGATLQYSGYNSATGRVTSLPAPGVDHIAGVSLLSNNAVNAVSASVTSAATALAALAAFGF